MAGLYRLAADICSLASALSIKWIVKSINDENKNQGNQTDPASENNDSELVVNNFWTSPYVIVFAIFAFSVLQGIFSQATSHFSILAGIRAKNAILVLLYEKTLTLPVINEQKQNSFRQFQQWLSNSFEQQQKQWYRFHTTKKTKPSNINYTSYDSRHLPQCIL